jgi:hypothetical protein
MSDSLATDTLNHDGTGIFGSGPRFAAESAEGKKA